MLVVELVETWELDVDDVTELYRIKALFGHHELVEIVGVVISSDDVERIESDNDDWVLFFQSDLCFSLFDSRDFSDNELVAFDHERLFIRAK